MSQAKNKKKGKNPGHVFTNNAFQDTEQSSYKHGFLNKRPGNPENDLHRAVDSITREINTNIERGNRPDAIFERLMSNDAMFNKTSRGGGSLENKTSFQNGARLIESAKGKKFKELSVTELEELGELNASQDRFRHRFGDDDYKDDVVRSGVRWID